MEFQLFSRGPLYQFYLWSGLVKKPLLLHQRRVMIVCLLAWLPLFILTLLSNVSLSLFLGDIGVHIRFLLSLALLLCAEVVANERFQIVVTHFLNCHIVTKQDRPAYMSYVASASKLSSSVIIEILFLVFVITAGRWMSQQVLPADVSVWYAVKKNNIVTLTLPGYWYAFVSLPIFQFILLRWYYRILLWYRFLWQVSKLRLQLNSLHPDKAGGLGFLVNSVYGFSLFLMSHSCLLAGIILNNIIHKDATIWQFQSTIICWVIFLIIIPLIPMLFFVVKLIRLQRDGTEEYDVVANQYVSDFRKKWITEEVPSKEKLVGTADIQALSDLAHSFEVTAHMRVVPIEKGTLLLIIVSIVLPLLPLALTVMPLNKLLNQALKMVF